MTELLSYAGLFFSALVAATVLPMQSEAVLVGLLASEKLSPILLVAVASLGNILGALINWMLGRSIEHYKDRSWFPASENSLARAQGWYGRYGKWSLLFSWLPVVGDPLTVVAGVMREPLPSFIILVAIGKVGRYVALSVATLKLI
ncbi:YqaA family protein [Brucella anthropi]|uniref:YqaA family protein n=1 Tax=Brucella anthropi TaxID=529 RepID=UPI00244CE251|nr:DedA family protein [Brucella anthropi]MDG9792099.1 DedA family protein [Brucella anthropi]MDH0581144.1 DedA family protein [Brucella anthropi]MDH0818038.1 DedA family protein [Brucella anthropi]MDH2085213.1 DedA family protein [Brucella anthropi]